MLIQQIYPVFQTHTHTLYLSHHFPTFENSQSGVWYVIYQHNRTNNINQRSIDDNQRIVLDPADSKINTQIFAVGRKFIAKNSQSVILQMKKNGEKRSVYRYKMCI